MKKIRDEKERKILLALTLSADQIGRLKIAAEIKKWSHSETVRYLLDNNTSLEELILNKH